MKLFISTDMEGIASVVSEKEVTSSEKEYERARHLMTQEVNAAIKGAYAAGVREVLVADAHASMGNIIPEELDERARLVRGAPRPLGMMAGLDASFSAVFFIGYHAMRGTEGGVLEHTYSGKTLFSLTINGEEVGELGLNAFLAGHFQVPLLLLTGDDKVVAEGEKLINQLETVVVKEGLGRYAASSLHPAKAREEITRKAERAIKRQSEIQPLCTTTPVHLEVVFNTSAMADMAALLPAAKRESGRHLYYQAKDYLEAYQVFRAMVSLASS